MRDSDYYAPGSYYDPYAPWNEVVVPERDFDVTCSQSLSKTVTITTDNYIPQCDEGFEDGIGYHDEWADTSDTVWADEYEKNEHLTPLQLIQHFKRYLEDIRDNSEIASKKPSYIKYLIEECEGWDEDEFEVVED